VLVRAYRRTCAGLPARVGNRIAALPLLEQVELAEAKGLPPLSPATVNKALSAIRVTLGHTVEELDRLRRSARNCSGSVWPAARPVGRKSSTAMAAIRVGTEPTPSPAA
jgi:hypothetical protein